MTIGELYENVGYFYNSDSRIIRGTIENLVMKQHIMSWKDELNETTFTMLKNGIDYEYGGCNETNIRV